MSEGNLHAPTDVEAATLRQDSSSSGQVTPQPEQDDDSKEKATDTKAIAHPLLYQSTTADVLVSFDGKNDPLDPQNWPLRKKLYTTALWAFTTCWITFASAIYSAGTEEISEEFQVSFEVANLGTSLLLFGFALGPMIFSPLCELYGRKWPALIPYFISAIFAFATASASNIQTILITRFFAGVFGSAPISITGGAIVDFWAPKERGTPMVFYGITIAAAPTLGPIIGSAVVSSYLGWRWTEYLTGIIMMAQLVLDVLFLSESHADILLVRKAAKLRHEGKNFALHAKWEENSPSFRDIVHTYLIRPFQLLLNPICLLITIYTSFVYAILYASILSVAYEYGQVRNLGPVIAQLPFLALLIGCFFAAAANIYNNIYYGKRFVANHFKAVPEARLPPMCYGGFVFSMGLFLFGWTSAQYVSSPWPSIVGIFFVGFGFTTIFQSSLQYLVDTFTRYSASAIAANTFVRSLAAGAFPLFVYQMYENIGVPWGSTIFGCISVLLLPVPFIFFKWGAVIRGKGEYSKLSTY